MSDRLILTADAIAIVQFVDVVLITFQTFFHPFGEVGNADILSRFKPSDGLERVGELSFQHLQRQAEGFYRGFPAA